MHGCAACAEVNINQKLLLPLLDKAQAAIKNEKARTGNGSGFVLFSIDHRSATESSARLRPFEWTIVGAIRASLHRFGLGGGIIHLLGQVGWQLVVDDHTVQQNHHDDEHAADPGHGPCLDVVEQAT